MARPARQRRADRRSASRPTSKPPAWRPFQLAFLLMNLDGHRRSPERPDREVVDLLFFPTGGGKTEAYLGLAAFTLVLRRLRNPGLASAGVSVLMRYTLRLLTLDQLSRAATLVCALELERRGGRRAARAVAVRDRAVGGARRRRRTGWGRRATTDPRVGAGEGRSPTRTTTGSRRRSRSRTAPGAATRFRPRVVPPGAERGPARGPAGRLRRTAACDFTGENAAADPGGRRADLPAAAVLPDRDRGQVREPAVGGRRWGRSSGGSSGTTSDGFYGPCDPGRGLVASKGRSCRRT